MAKRTPRTFTIAATVVDIEINPTDLEEAGWVYVGDRDDADIDPADVLATVRRWHDETRPDPWKWCLRSPCRELNVRFANTA